jgi:hypothetical protein
MALKVAGAWESDHMYGKTGIDFTSYETPIWIDSEGREWEFEPAHEQCESPQACLRPTVYVGRKGKSLHQLCEQHFDELVLPGCKLAWGKYY